MNTIETDVAIIGGGPGGATCGGFLRKHDPSLRVTIFERETFPRDHIGESQLPMVCGVLNELGVWDRIEACNFPVKIGATYRWGNSDDLWDFDFLAHGRFDNQPRPSKFEGQRRLTAFQVDRSIYDKVLLDYAEELGCDVHYNSPVREIRKHGDRIDALVLADGTTVKAKFYVDASGNVALLRRAMGVQIEEPSALRNIAVWDYWRNAEWAETIGIGGTRIQVMSLGYGWIWFIPIGEDRTSIGFVCPADYYKSTGKPIEELYTEAIAREPRITNLIQNARRENLLATTKDWSFVSERMAGDNWFLVGEAAGFADPILSAGLTLTHVSARELAFLILEANRGGDLDWMRQEYFRRNNRRIRQHIQFADYWYRANTHFSDLKQYTSEIAREAGLELSAEQAFQWLGTGGFVEEDAGLAGLALHRYDRLHQLVVRLSEKPAESMLDGYNVFHLDLSDAVEVELASFEDGRVTAIPALQREGKTLPLNALFGWLVRALQHSPRFDTMANHLVRIMTAAGYTVDEPLQARLWECLDAMVRDGWVKRDRTDKVDPIEHRFLLQGGSIHTHEDRD